MTVSNTGATQHVDASRRRVSFRTGLGGQGLTLGTPYKFSVTAVGWGDISPGVASTAITTTVRARQGDEAAVDEAATESRYEQLAGAAQIEAQKLFKQKRSRVLKGQVLLADAQERALSWFDAAESMHTKAVTRLLSSTDISTRDACGRTALHIVAAAIAAEPKTKEIIRALLGAGADPMAIDHHGQNPLHLAAASGNLPAVELILQHAHGPAAGDAEDYFQHKPAAMAGLNGHVAVAQFLGLHTDQCYTWRDNKTVKEAVIHPVTVSDCIDFSLLMANRGCF